jgi:hypothetical protein
VKLTTQLHRLRMSGVVLLLYPFVTCIGIAVLAFHLREDTGNTMWGVRDFCGGNAVLV